MVIIIILYDLFVVCVVCFYLGEKSSHIGLQLYDLLKLRCLSFCKSEMLTEKLRKNGLKIKLKYK